MSDVAFTRSEMLPEQDPPATSVGVIGWLQSRLFSGWFNTVLTVLVVLALAFVLYEFLPWALSPTWDALSLTECREILVGLGQEQGHTSGACWVLFGNVGSSCCSAFTRQSFIGARLRPSFFWAWPWDQSCFLKWFRKSWFGSQRSIRSCFPGYYGVVRSGVHCRPWPGL